MYTEVDRYCTDSPSTVTLRAIASLCSADTGPDVATIAPRLTSPCAATTTLCTYRAAPAVTVWAPAAVPKRMPGSRTARRSTRRCVTLRSPLQRRRGREHRVRGLDGAGVQLVGPLGDDHVHHLLHDGHVGHLEEPLLHLAHPVEAGPAG